MEMVTSYCHLGHVVNSNLDDSPAIINRQCSFIGQVNSVLCFFGKLSSKVKIRLFRSYCTSFYGCELWNLSCAQLADLCAKWRKSVRRVLNLPLQTHCYLLLLLCQCLPVYDEICGRTMNFVRSCLYHQSSVVKSVAFYTVVTALPLGAMYYSVCNAIKVLLMTFYHVTRSSILYVVLCLLAVQMTSTMRVVCYLNVLECEMVY